VWTEQRVHEHDFGADYGPSPQRGGADTTHGHRGGETPAEPAARTRRLEALRREAAAVAQARAAARAEVARLTTAPRWLTPEERKAVTRLRLEAQARWLRLRELRAEVERLREARD
jgi:hypothetical protein